MVFTKEDSRLLEQALIDEIAMYQTMISRLPQIDKFYDNEAYMSLRYTIQRYSDLVEKVREIK